MRIKKVRIGIKSTKEILQGFVKTCKAVERGEKVKKEVSPTVNYDAIELMIAV